MPVSRFVDVSIVTRPDWHPLPEFSYQNNSSSSTAISTSVKGAAHYGLDSSRSFLGGELGALEEEDSQVAVYIPAPEGT